jgi:predicted DNA-binding protein (UPF0251 family)
MRKRLGRPCAEKIIRHEPRVKFFKPNGIKIPDLELIEIKREELEALRLKNIKQMEQIEAAKEMGISQSTFQRILSSAYEKISDALVNGKAIKILE